MPSLPAGTFPSTYDNSQYTSFERTPGAGYLTTVGSLPHGSTYFDGTGDYLTIANSQNFYSLGTADWTIEFWVYFTDVSVFNGVFQIGEDVGALSAMLYTDGKLKLLENDQAIVFESNRTFSANTWYHIVYTNDDASNTQRLYVNGVAEANTGSKSTAYSFGNKTVYIGGRYFSGSFQRDMNGYISNFRVVGGSVVYPPASGGGSAYFDGTDDLLKVANNTSFRLGTGDFTIECWVYFDDTSLESGSNRRIFNLHETGNAVDNLQIVIDDGGYRKAGDLFLYSNSIQGYLDTDIRSGWHHIAVVRNSGTLKFYLDGVEKHSISNNQDYSPGGVGGPIPIIGQRGDDKGDYDGYISNFRLSDNARYTPSPVYGGLDLVSQNTSVSSHAGLDFGTDDFTVEFFFKWDSNSGYQTLIDHNYSSAGGFTLQSNSGTYKWGLWGDVSKQYESTNATQDVWHHYAIVRNGNTVKMYRDGVETLSKSHSGSVGSTNSTTFGHGTYSVNGKISNFRVVKGTALYTSAGFTIPSSSLTAISGTSLLLFQENSGSTLSDGSTNSYTVNIGGNSGNILTSDGPFPATFTVPTSPFNNDSNTLLLTCQNNTGSITDASSSNHVITANGNTAANSDHPF